MTAPAAGITALSRRYLQRFPAGAARLIEAALLAEAVTLLESEPTPSAVPVVDRLTSRVAADVLQAAAPDLARRFAR